MGFDLVQVREPATQLVGLADADKSAGRLRLVDQAQVDRYGVLMRDLALLVVDKYDGALKAEHGSGRNMAPFVRDEWGQDAYALMRDIKALFDPQGILNPGKVVPSAGPELLDAIPRALR